MQPHTSFLFILPSRDQSSLAGGDGTFGEYPPEYSLAGGDGTFGEYPLEYSLAGGDGTFGEYPLEYSLAGGDGTFGEYPPEYSFTSSTSFSSSRGILTVSYAELAAYPTIQEDTTAIITD
jgi:hypothetical protein